MGYISTSFNLYTTYIETGEFRHSNSMTSIAVLSVLLVFSGIVLARPAIKTIVINNHEWEVPDEPGWEEVIQEVTLLQQQLMVCVKAEECRRIVQQVHDTFYRYPASRNYFETHKDDADDMFTTIFKWG